MKIGQHLKLNFKKYVILSLSAHLFLFLFFWLAPQFQTKKETSVEITLVEPEQLKPEEISQLKKIPEPQVVRQIVQTDEKVANNELDKKSRFLSAKNNTVEKETIAKEVGKFKNSDQQSSQAQAQAQKQVKAQAAKQAQKTEQVESEKRPPQLFSSGFDAYASLTKKQDAQEERKAQARQIALKNGDASATNDHIDNVDTSLKTQLNTREYLYYGYHKRIRDQLDQWYQANLREQLKKIFSQGRTVASVENKRTQLLIVLNNKGSLVTVHVLGISGVKELDDAAIETFKKAAPFPNPPKGMVDADGTIKVRWDFVLS